MVSDLSKDNLDVNDPDAERKAAAIDAEGHSVFRVNLTDEKTGK